MSCFYTEKNIPAVHQMSMGKYVYSNTDNNDIYSENIGITYHDLLVDMYFLLLIKGYQGLN